MAERFRARAGDEFVSRHGGDEFTFISLNPQQPETAGNLARRLLEQAAGDFEYERNKVHVDLSIGISIFPDDGETTSILMNSADAALYRSKAEGRGIVRYFEPEMDIRLHEQRRIKQDLQLAVSNNELQLHFQPQATVDKKVFGFEALPRWRHPVRGFIPLRSSFRLLKKADRLSTSANGCCGKHAGRQQAGPIR